MLTGRTVTNENADAIEGRLSSLPPIYFPTVSCAVVLCVTVPEVPVNVSVVVPLDAPFGTAKSTVTFAVSSPDTSVTDEGVTVQVEPVGPPLHVRLMVPWNPELEESVRV